MSSASRRRVVVTGMGAVTPLANNLPGTWDAVLNGRSGVRRITQFDPSRIPCKIAAEVIGLESHIVGSAKEWKRMSRSARLALVAASEAFQDSGLDPNWSDPFRIGILVGTGVGGLDSAIENWEIYKSKGIRAVKPYALISALPNMPSFYVGKTFQARGPISTCAAACATGTQALGDASEWIRRGVVDIVIAGGVEGLIIESALAGFSALRALSLRNDEPTRASRPFDADRDGFVMGEGAGIMVLEAAKHAEKRNARIYAELLGHGESSDAFHAAAPHPEAIGAKRAISQALDDAQLGVESIDYINAHGSATPLNDRVETIAIKEVFGNRAKSIPMNSTKSMFGHLMGAAGAVEAVISVLSIVNDQIHPTINLETPDPECDLDYVPLQGRDHQVRTALSNSFGLGGQNASVIFREWKG